MTTDASSAIQVASRVHGFSYAIRNIVTEARAVQARGLHVRYMDIGDQFLESDGSISVEVMADALHPTERGYQIWADAVMPTFRELLGRN